jgi:hypothetical protein
MARVAALVLILVSSLPAHAELAKLGDFSLTDKVKKAGFAKVTLYGCKGSLKHDMGKGKVEGITFSADSACTAIEAAIKKEYPGAPLTSTDGLIKLWEGKTSSVLLTRGELRLVLPGAGAKRTCFADDGFAAFLATFKTAVAGGKLDAVAATFKFPVKDYDDKVVIKDAKAFAKKWPAMLDGADAKALATELEATCNNPTDTYDLSLPESSFSLEAHKVGDRWLWVEINERAPG